MNSRVDYFRSQKYTTDEQISEVRALQIGTYVRAIFDDNGPERAEIFNEGQLKALVYYGRDPQDYNLARRHCEEYGLINMTICGPPLFTPEGTLQILSKWSPSCEPVQTIKQLIDDRGEPLREEVFDGGGAPQGVRRFEYDGTDLIRIVFTRADGAEIIELED
jgi:hypothetical protein